MQLQGPDNKRVRAVCFAKDKQTTLLEKQNTLSPVKISNYIVGPSCAGEGEEIRINDMSIIQAPSANEYNFQYIPNDNASGEPEITAVSVVQSEIETGTIVNVKGKIKKVKMSKLWPYAISVVFCRLLSGKMKSNRSETVLFTRLQT
jgi:predicted ATP-dependent protease